MLEFIRNCQFENIYCYSLELVDPINSITNDDWVGYFGPDKMYHLDWILHLNLQNYFVLTLCFKRRVRNVVVNVVSSCGLTLFFSSSHKTPPQAIFIAWRYENRTHRRLCNTALPSNRIVLTASGIMVMKFGL